MVMSTPQNKVTRINYDPEAPALTDAQTKSAMAALYMEYPKVSRHPTDPPIPNQTISLLSFMLLDEPKKFSSGRKVYGFVKFRGSYLDEQYAKKEAAKLVRDVDSSFMIRAAPTGHWVP